jgi:hypothetical protein
MIASEVLVNEKYLYDNKKVIRCIDVMKTPVMECWGDKLIEMSNLFEKEYRYVCVFQSEVYVTFALNEREVAKFIKRL